MSETVVMPRFHVDDGLDSDRRIERVSLAAVGLFVRAVSYTARYLTDGFVDDPWLKSRVGRRDHRDRLAAELEAAQLWERVDGGYRISPLHNDADLLVNCFTRDEAEAYRRSEAARKRIYREKKRSEETAQEWEEPPDVLPGHHEGHHPESLVRAGKEWTSNGLENDPWAIPPEERRDDFEPDYDAEIERIKAKWNGEGR